MTKKLRISDKLSIPLEIVTAKTTILGMPGSGKSWLMMLLAERFLEASAQVVFLDPKGEAWGLRLGADGKTPAFSIPIFGGDHQDYPLRPDMGRRVAELIVDGDYSAVLDVSHFISSELAQFGYEFATRLFELKKRKPGAMSLMLDEAEDFIPENPSERGYETKMLGAFQRVCKQLRSKGVGMVFCSPRPQEVSKKCINLSEFWFLFQILGVNERVTLKKLLKSQDESEAEVVDTVLPALEVGRAHVFSPRVLKTSAEFAIGERVTFDTSYTPTVGDRRVVPRKLAPVDAKALAAAMEDIVEEERAKDPDALNDVIVTLRRDKADLETRLKRAEAKTPAPAKPSKPKIVPAVTDRQAADIQAAVDAIDPMLLKFESHFATAVEQLKSTLEAQFDRFKQKAEVVIKASEASVSAAKAAVEEQTSVVLINDSLGESFSPAAPIEFGRVPLPAQPIEVPTSTKIDWPKDGDGPTRTQIDIVRATAVLEAWEIRNPPLPLIAIVRGVSHTTGTFQDDCRKVAAAGYVLRQNGGLSLTPAGQEAIKSLPPLATLKTEADLHRFLLGSLAQKSKPRADILAQVIAFYPARVRRDNLAKALNKSHTTGTFQDDARKLRNAGLMTFPDKDTFRAADVLFPKTRKAVA